MLGVGLDSGGGGEVFEVAYDFGEFSLAAGIGAGAFCYCIFLDIPGPVYFGPTTAPFTTICNLPCHSPPWIAEFI
jgi:hypothetical protein